MDNVKILPDNGNVLNNLCLTDNVNNLSQDNVNNITNVKLVTVSQEGIHTVSNFTYTSHTNIKTISSSSSATSVKISPTMVKTEEERNVSNSAQNGNSLNDNFSDKISGKEELSNKALNESTTTLKQINSETTSVNAITKEENSNVLEKLSSQEVQSLEDTDKQNISSSTICPKSENDKTIKEEEHSKCDTDDVDQIRKRTSVKDSMEGKDNVNQSDILLNKPEIHTDSKVPPESSKELLKSNDVSKPANDSNTTINDTSKTEVILPDVKEPSEKPKELQAHVEETLNKLVPSDNTELSQQDEHKKKLETASNSESTNKETPESLAKSKEGKSDSVKREEENDKDKSREQPRKFEEPGVTEPKAPCTEKSQEEEKAPAVEETIVKKDSPGTGFDDNVIEEWKKVEEKEGTKTKEANKEPKDEKKKAIEGEIVSKSEAGNDTFDSFMNDVITDYEDKDSKKDSKNKNKNLKKDHKVPPVKEEKISKAKTKENETSQEPEDTITKSVAKSQQESSPEKKEQAKLKKEEELKEQHKQIVKAVRKLLPEEGHDSGVDETTQSKDGSSKSPPKNGRISPKKRQPRSVDPSPMKRTPQSTASIERKLPMNKVEVGKSASPNIKNVRSKIGSLDNATYRPGGGKIKIESKKLDFSKASSRITAKNDAYTPGGGDKKIEVQKLKWNANSKIGSLDNKDHKPGGGDKKVESQKLHFKDKALSKIGSKDNIKHKAGGGDVEIATEKLEFRAKASSKIGSLDNVKHKPKGGEKKIFDDKEYLRQMQSSSSNQSPCKTPTSKTSSGRESGAISPATTGTNSPGPQEE